MAALRHRLKIGRLTHALLLTGERHLGKTALAMALAESLLGPTPLTRHPDFWIDDEDGPLRVGELRRDPRNPPERHRQTLQEFVSEAPLISAWKVAVLCDLGRIQEPTQNLLLKILEEPLKRRLLIVTAGSTAPHEVLPTVVSRCHVLRLHPAADDELAALARRHGARAADLGDLVAMADGRPGRLLRALNDPELLQAHRKASLRVQRVREEGVCGALKAARELDAQAVRGRRAGRSSSGPGNAHAAGPDGADEMAGTHRVEDELAIWQPMFARQMRTCLDHDPQRAARWAEVLQQSFECQLQLTQNVSRRLALEVLLLRLAHIDDQQSNQS